MTTKLSFTDTCWTAKAIDDDRRKVSATLSDDGSCVAIRISRPPEENEEPTLLLVNGDRARLVPARDGLVSVTFNLRLEMAKALTDVVATAASQVPKNERKE